MGSVSIQEVESALAGYPGLASVAVVAHGTEPADQCLVAYVAPSGPGLDVPRLHAYARTILPGPLMPAAIVVLDQIPVTAGGTTDFTALPAPDLAGLMPYRAPVTARQETLCTLFAEALGVTRCGVDDDFFNLGGQSVGAMLLAGQISAALGVRMSMADLFKAPTVAELDRRLDVAATTG